MSQVLGIVPARGGSKGIPGKNIRHLAGKPLLAYTAEAANKSGVIDRLVLTTDTEDIARVGRTVGLDVPFLRPPALAQDDTPMLPVLKHVVQQIEKSGGAPDIIVLLQPTAPLRKPEHIRQAVKLLQDRQADSVVSVVEVPAHYSPYYVMKLENERLVNFLPEGQKVTRRQDAPKAYSRDGTVYVFWRDLLMNENTIYGENSLPLVIDHQDSINLDTLDDWAEAESYLMAQGLSR